MHIQCIHTYVWNIKPSLNDPNKQPGFRSSDLVNPFFHNWRNSRPQKWTGQMPCPMSSAQSMERSHDFQVVPHPQLLLTPGGRTAEWVWWPHLISARLPTNVSFQHRADRRVFCMETRDFLLPTQAEIHSFLLPINVLTAPTMKKGRETPGVKMSPWRPTVERDQPIWQQYEG